MAAALGVRLAVLGSFQRNGDRVRITARVVDVASGEALADAKVDGRLDEIFSLQDQVVAQFAGELGVAANAGTARRSRETASLEAYRAVTEGWLKIETLDVKNKPVAISREKTIDLGTEKAELGLSKSPWMFLSMLLALILEQAWAVRLSCHVRNATGPVVPQPLGRGTVMA